MIIKIWIYVYAFKIYIIWNIIIRFKKYIIRVWIGKEDMFKKKWAKLVSFLKINSI